jgi:pilus assembly protein CpaC
MKATKLFSKFLCLCLALCQALVAQPAFASYDSDNVGYQEIQILKGDVYNVPTENLSRVSVTDPNVVDINNAKPQEVTLIGKEAGQTALFVWDDAGKRTYIVRVIEEDLGLLQARVASLLESAGLNGIAIKENPQEGKVVLTGSLSEKKLANLETIMDPFAGRIINFVQKEDIQDLIQIDMQITELSTTLTKAMGVDWTTGSDDSMSPSWKETMPAATGEFRDLFKLGDFNRTTAITAKVNALIKEGKAKVLSKPRLVVVNGKEATFLVGGEIPIRTTTSNSTGGSVQQNVEFKEYGVSMAITPTIKDGKVDILMNIEISDIDAANTSGNDVAFVTRSAQTQLFLDDRQTIVLAGLIKRSKSLDSNRVPLLGSIPVVGLLFRSKKTPSPDTETEVVISLTPTILRSAQKKVALTVQADPVSAGAISGSMMVSDQPPAMMAPVLTKNAAGLPVTVPATIEPYARSVQEKISSAIAYPYEAQENGWQGTVKLSLVIRRDGSLRDAVIRESSGYDVFDQDALNTAQILAPYNPFPESIAEEQLTITIPIVYSLDSFLKNVAKHK